LGGVGRGWGRWAKGKVPAGTFPLA
jgi:hypothetical protein